MLTLKEFKEARGVLRGVISDTELVHSPYFSDLSSLQSRLFQGHRQPDLYQAGEYAGHRGLQDPGRLL